MRRRATERWVLANQRYLSAAIALVRAKVESKSSNEAGASEAIARTEIELRDAAREMPSPSALDRLVTTLELSSFERDVLLLAAGVELSSEFARACAKLRDDGRPHPTFGLALGALEDAHWSAIVPAGPLRRWGLVAVDAGTTLTTSALRIDEAILHYLAGVDEIDARLAPLVREVVDEVELVESHRAVADRLASVLARATKTGRWPLLHVTGEDLSEKRAIARHVAHACGLTLFALSAIGLPAGPNEIDALARQWTRQSLLGGCALLLECDGVDAADPTRLAVLAQTCERIGGPLFVSTRDRIRVCERPTFGVEIDRPTRHEQRQLWFDELRDAAKGVNGEIDALVHQFNLGASSIRSLAGGGTLGEGQEIVDELWSACSARSRQRLDDLADRILPAAGWDDLVLPAPQMEVLRQVTAHLRHRAKVYESWGFGRKGSRGLGISALFAGASGTGKTMAAEVIANELRLDLYRIDLSQVVSKYIGETEKNLRRVFDAAEEGGAILLFDEADALFGRRGEVKDSHDRYANIEVSYLLQRMESYRGLAILTTNMKDALDSAFLRRIRFMVHFPFPDTSQRAEIWRRIFPGQTPTKGLDFDKLAMLNVAGGNIRNVALHAAFLAADAQQDVGMEHLLRAARAEYTKLERSLTEREIKGWT